MPLSHKPLVLSFDGAMQAELGAIYRELCQLIDPQIPACESERLRTEICDRLLQIAEKGERDRSMLKRKTAAYFNLL